MNSVNLDLLRAGARRHADPHAHHKAEHLANLRAARRQRWLDSLARLCALFARHSAPTVQPCPERPS